MTTVEDLYNRFSVLADAKEKAGEHQKDYRVILDATKSSNSNEKRLASQFVVRFFKFFPHLADESLQAIFMLCEDQDVTTRKQAIKDLSTICRDSPQYAQQVAGVVTSMMQTNDTIELNIIHMSLTAVLKAEPKGTLTGIFANILKDEGLIRDRAISFLGAKTKILLTEDFFSKDVEDTFVQHCKEVLADVTEDEFQIFMRILTSLPSMGTVQGRQALLDIVIAEADLGSKFDPKSSDCYFRLTLCVKEALQLFSKNVHSTKFVEYMCLSVLPVLDDVALPSASDKENDGYRLTLVQNLAEMVSHCGELESVEQCVLSVYSCLLTFMPLPKSELSPDVSNTDHSNIQHSFVECLMFAFHCMARRCPQILTDASNTERLKDFRIRLQYFAAQVKYQMTLIKSKLQEKNGNDSKDGKADLSIALCTANNISALIRDLFYNPPAYKATVVMSFKKHMMEKSSTKPESPPVTGVKRPSFTPVTFESSEPSKKVTKTERQIYAPPGGKFSEKAGSFTGQQGSNQRGRRGGYKRW